MRRLSALALSLLLLLTACGTPGTPDDAAVLPTPNDEILVEEGLRAEDLPEACRLWFDLADTSGAADKSSKLPLAARADEGACDYLAVRMPDGSYTDLIQEGRLADEGVSLADFSGGGAKQEGSYGQLAWNGELYHAFTVSAADCAIPNLSAPDGGVLRLNLSGDCTADGGGTEYACFEGFDCVVLTGDGTLTVTNATALDCGRGDLPIPALVLDGDVTLRCDEIRLAAPNAVDVPALAVLGGTLCTDTLWLNNGALLNADGTLSVQDSVQELTRAVFRGGTTLLGAAEQRAEFILSGGTAHLAGDLAEGSTVEGGAGVFSAQSFSGAAVNDYDTGAALWDGADGSAYRGVYGAGYYPTVYSPEWADAASGAAWDALNAENPYEDDWFAGVLTLENSRAPELLPWGAVHLRVLGDNAVDGTLGGTGLLFTGGGSLTAGDLNVWSWGSVRAPLLAVRDGTSVRGGALHMGSNAEEEGTLLVESGSLMVDGEFWLQNAALAVTGGELTLAGDASIDRGEVRISGGTVTLGGALWLGEGDIVITGGTVVVPGGQEGLIAENGTVTVTGGTIREP